ncbi:MAG: OmpA family protein [Gemmatimonadetes bacterium]|nr:OmpA family protein [Gemmatimonadota bacterium]
MDETSAPDLAKLRRILVGEERARLDQLEAKVEDNRLSAERLAARLPEAIVLRAAQDRQLARALAPTVEGAISESVRRKPGEFADAIFPVLGPAIRKAIAETMAELVGSINRAMQHSFSARGLSWRFESWRTGVPYAAVVIKHALVYRVEQVFLVHRETGLLLAQAHPPNLAVPDADLVSGMLTAIRDFVGDSFSAEKEVGGLRTFSVGELTVMVEQGPKALLAAVVRGQAPESYLRRLQETIEGVHGQFPSALAEFEGDTTPFEAAQPLLEDCLVTVLDTDQPVGAKVNWTPWVVGLGLVALVIAAWWTWSVLEFNRAVRALRATPGIVVVEASRGWRTHEVRGLSDPSGATPATVLRAAGVEPARVTQQWEPYVSLTPSLVVARAARVLGPTSVGKPALVLRGETLMVRGPADAPWLARVARRTGWPAGVAGVDLREATPVLPAALVRAGDSLVAGQVLFAPGSAALDDAAAAAVRTAARHARAIAAGLADDGVTVGLTLTGRTDATGTDSTNQSLSRERAERVRRALEGALRGGGAAPVLTTRGVGTREPLSESDSTARARINRSVSFGIRLSIDATPGARPR